MAENPLEFKDYVDAVSALANNFAMDAGLKDENGKKIIAKYNEYLLKKQTEGKGEVDKFETWKLDRANLAAAIPGISPEEQDKAAALAEAYLNGNTKVTAAKAAITENGKLMVAKAGGFMDKAWDFIKKNKFTAGAAALGAVAGNALGLGWIGTILLAVGGAVAGAVLGDKENGFIGSKLFNMQPPVKQGDITPGVMVGVNQQVAVSSLDKEALTPLKDMGKDEKLGLAQVKDYVPVPNQPDLKKEGVDKQFTVEKEDRVITYYGKMEGATFSASFSRVTQKDETKTSPTYDIRKKNTEAPDDTAKMAPGITFKTEKNATGSDTMVVLDHGSSQAVVNNTNKNLETLTVQRVAGPTKGADSLKDVVPTNIEVKVTKQPDASKDESPVTLVLTDKDQDPDKRDFIRTFEGTYNKKDGTLTITQRTTRKDGALALENLTKPDADPAKPRVANPVVIKDVKLNGNEIDLTSLKPTELKSLIEAAKSMPLSEGTYLSKNILEVEDIRKNGFKQGGGTTLPKIVEPKNPTLAV